MAGKWGITRLVGNPLVRARVNQGFQLHARRRVSSLDRADPVETQNSVLRGLVSRARGTLFGRDHGFDSIRDLRAYQSAVPLRTYEQLWNDYLKPNYPRLLNVTWPGVISYFALTSGTTNGPTKYIPVSRAMLASNVKAARTLVAYHMAASGRSRLFHGKLFFLGGSTALEEPAAGIFQGDLSGIAAWELKHWLRPYAFPPLDLALEADWDRKLTRLAEASLRQPITLVGGVPSWLLLLFERLLQLSGKTTIAEVWPGLELVVHGGVSFDPYRRTFDEVLGDPRVRLQESYPASEGFIAFGDPETGLLRLCFDHGIFYEFVPVDDLDSPRPTRHWLGDAQVGVNYAIVMTTCAGLWSHVIGDTVRFESLDPPLLRFTGRTKYSLSAFGEHLIGEEIEAAVASAAELSGASVRDWHVGPVFLGSRGFHRFVVEFLRMPEDLGRFRDALDGDLSRRNADYRAHRADGLGLPRPALVVARPGSLDDWMRARGKLGGQHKFPRMDASGRLTAELVAFLTHAEGVLRELPPG